MVLSRSLIHPGSRCRTVKRLRLVQEPDRGRKFRRIVTQRSGPRCRRLRHAHRSRPPRRPCCRNHPAADHGPRPHRHRQPPGRCQCQHVDAGIEQHCPTPPARHPPARAQAACGRGAHGRPHQQRGQRRRGRRRQLVASRRIRHRREDLGLRVAGGLEQPGRRPQRADRQHDLCRAGRAGELHGAPAPDRAVLDHCRQAPVQHHRRGPVDRQQRRHPDPDLAAADDGPGHPARARRTAQPAAHHRA